MIRIECRTHNGEWCGFEVSGHAGTARAGRDTVCAAVSSAVYMAANTVTEVVTAPADIVEQDGYLSLTVTDKVAACQTVLAGFRLHMQALQSQYPTRIHLTITEV